MVRRSVTEIIERTEPGTYNLHLYDNGSGPDTVQYLLQLKNEGKLTSLVLDSRNTGCLYNKNVFHAMCDPREKYYVVSDDDVFPPKMSPDWLSQMISIMDRHPEVALLTPQLPPQFLQSPYEALEDIVYCHAVGNTLKMVRRESFPAGKIDFMLGAYGDDGLVSQYVEKSGMKVAFCRNFFCLHAGQCENWGYRPEDVHLDPRKSGYGPPYRYEIVNQETYEPHARHRI